MNWEGKRITIIGAAKSGQALAQLAVRLKAKVKISDNQSADNISDDFKEWLKASNVKSEWQEHTREFIVDSDTVVLSPGVPHNAQPVVWAQEKGIPVIGEIEFASRQCQAPIIAVTGSNGKTTVVTLIAEILKRANVSVCLCGNIGVPFSDVVETLDEKTYVVLEVSSFQLETIVDFKPHIAVFLNFSENHLDRHCDLDEYFSAKRRIFLNQDSQDYAVLNANDEHVKSLQGQLKAKSVLFNTPAQQDQLKIKNPNFLAAAQVAQLVGVSDKVSKEVFASFKGVEHRLENVRTIDGVDFINDSKATTAEAGRWAIERINQPIVMICGGRDKNIDFSTLSEIVKEKVKTMIVFGESRAKIKQAFQSVTGVKECEEIREAVDYARQCALPGDCILFSPMCTSFDMFSNFEERGDTYKQIVNNLN